MGIFSRLKRAVKSTVKTFASPKGLLTLAIMVGTAGIGAGFAAGTITSFGGAVAALGSSATWMAGLTSVGISLGLGAVSAALLGSDDSGRGRSIQDIGAQGAKFQFRSPVAVREIVYGETRKSGVITYIGSSGGSSGTEYLQMHIAISGDKTSGITKLFVNDVVVKSNITNTTSGSITPDSGTTPDYSTKMNITYKDGSFPQTYGGTKYGDMGSTPNTHRMDGISFVAVQMQYDANLFSQGTPNFSFLIKGKEVYDPRTGTLAYSNNPALCIRDYLINKMYGLGCTPEEIDEDAFEVAANVCDTEGYELNGVVSTDKSPAVIIKDMLTSCSGTLRYSNGKFAMLAAQYVTPVKTITEDDLIDEVSITATDSSKDTFNEVKAIHFSSGTNQVKDIFVQNDLEIFAKDGYQISSVDLSLPFTTDPTKATSLAELALYRGQNQMTANITVNLKHFDVAIGDNIYFDYPRLGFNQKVFEVTSWSFAASGESIGINLGLRENSSSSYTGFPASGNIIKRKLAGLSKGNSANDLFSSAEWTGSSDKVILIHSRAILTGEFNTSTFESEPALYIDQNLGGTLTIYNRGQIYGMQGQFDTSYSNDGGPAIEIASTVASQVKIINDGIIAGGGGAGGVGGRSAYATYWPNSSASTNIGGYGPADGGDGAGWNGTEMVWPNSPDLEGQIIEYTGSPITSFYGNDITVGSSGLGGTGGGFGEPGGAATDGGDSTNENDRNLTPPLPIREGFLASSYGGYLQAGNGGEAVKNGANAEILNREALYGSIT